MSNGSTVQASAPASGADAHAIPELEPHCGSWVCTAPDGQVLEFYSLNNVERAERAGWRIETAAQYLARFNREFSSNHSTSQE